MKVRLDRVLVERALVPSRERAQALILAGRVLVDEQKIDKPGTRVEEGAAIRLLGDEQRYVSRGGLKLERALAYWGVALRDSRCVDIGASTGGFTDCMLQHGAQSVLAVDTGYGQMADKLRRDERVSLRERTNARLLVAGDLLQGDAGYSFFAMDVAFISATLVLPAVLRAMARAGERWHGEAVVLVKPQFEAGREHVGKGGIVRDPAARELAVRRVWASVEELGGTGVAVIDSPITGMEGNHEYLLHATFGRQASGEAALAPVHWTD